MTQVNIQSAQAPREVQEAFDDVIRAREDEQREKNQAEAYANGVVPEARGQAQRIIEEANGYRDEVISRAQGEADRFSKLLVEYRKAPEVTRERLYLDTMQEVFSQTSKVLVTGQQGQNNLLYLPLDKMIDGRNAAPLRVPVLPPVVAAPALPTWGRGSSTTCASKTRVRGEPLMGNKSLIALIVGVVAAIVLWNSVYVVQQTERAVMLRFGRVVESDVKPGLHFKIPYVNQVRKFDARLLTLDAPTQRFLTLESGDGRCLCQVAGGGCRALIPLPRASSRSPTNACRGVSKRVCATSSASVPCMKWYRASATR